MRCRRIPYEENHRAVDEILEKRCNTCGEWLPCTKDYFYINKKNTTDGLHPECKKCSIARSTKWAKNNPEWYKALADKKNKNPAKSTIEKWKNNARKQVENGYRRNWENKNRDKISQYNRFRRMNKTHNINENEWKACLSYFENSCAYCGMTEADHKEKYKERLHKEHVIHDGDNDLSNCIPACKKCNCSKHTSDIDEWYPLQKFYDEERLNKIYQWVMEDYKSELKLDLI